MRCRWEKVRNFSWVKWGDSRAEGICWIGRATRRVWPPVTLTFLSHNIIWGVISWVIGKNRICEVKWPWPLTFAPTDTLIFVPKSKLVPKFKKLPQGVLKIMRWQKWVRRMCICIQVGRWTSWKYYASSRGYRPHGCVTKHPYAVSRRGIKAAQNERKAVVEIVISVLLTDKCICTEAQTHTSAALSFLL